MVLALVVLVLANPRIAHAGFWDWFGEKAQAARGEETASFPQAAERSPSYTRRITATSYTSHVNQTDSSPFVPASGVNYREEFEKNGVIYAIAANDVPLGTEVKFAGLSEVYETLAKNRPDLADKLPDFSDDTVFTVEDRMNKRYTGKSRIDFYILVADSEGNLDLETSLDIARAFGVKTLTMEVFPRGNK